MLFILPHSQKNKMSKEKDKLLMPPPPPRLMPFAKGMLEQLPPLPPLMLLPPLLNITVPYVSTPTIAVTKPSQKVSSRTSNASITLLSLNPPAKPIKPKQVTFFEIQIKQKLMETVRMHSMAYVEPSSPLAPLDLVQKLLLAAKPF